MHVFATRLGMASIAINLLALSLQVGVCFDLFFVLLKSIALFSYTTANSITNAIATGASWRNTRSNTTSSNTIAATK
jgi:hypothetical protein